ncbi:MAG: phosphate acetyltransferase [Bacteroidales bacterium]|jgi:phosphate acetyltransferase|nr:phosphate acetyltransferase [Bacteroidales bacterium]
MDLMSRIVDKAKAKPQRIVLSEGTEIRTLQAAEQLLNDQVAEIVLIGNPDVIKEIASEREWNNIDKAIIVDPENNEKKQLYTELLFDLRKSKGMTMEEAETLVKNPLYLACLMIKNGDADGEVAGAINTTGNVLRPAFQIIKTLPGIKVISGAFLMFIPNKSYGEAGLLIFADCAVNPVPTAQEMAEIAICTAKTARDIAGIIEPRVAMLSFSTKGSATHEVVDKVAQATAIARELNPNLLIDGEMQADTALVPSVGTTKAPGSPVAGKANILVFPSLEAGNIGYKLTQRLSGGEAVGPILQGIAAPINDLSRGCSWEDIYKMVAVTANQAIGIKSRK